MPRRTEPQVRRLDWRELTGDPKALVNLGSLHGGVAEDIDDPAIIRAYQRQFAREWSAYFHGSIHYTDHAIQFNDGSVLFCLSLSRFRDTNHSNESAIEWWFGQVR